MDRCVPLGYFLIAVDGFSGLIPEFGTTWNSQCIPCAPKVGSHSCAVFFFFNTRHQFVRAVGTRGHTFAGAKFSPCPAVPAGCSCRSPRQDSPVPSASSSGDSGADTARPSPRCAPLAFSPRLPPASPEGAFPVGWGRCSHAAVPAPAARGGPRRSQRALRKLPRRSRRTGRARGAAGRALGRGGGAGREAARAGGLAAAPAALRRPVPRSAAARPGRWARDGRRWEPRAAAAVAAGGGGGAGGGQGSQLPRSSDGVSAATDRAPQAGPRRPHGRSVPPAPRGRCSGRGRGLRAACGPPRVVFGSRSAPRRRRSAAAFGPRAAARGRRGSARRSRGSV